MELFCSWPLLTMSLSWVVNMPCGQRDADGRRRGGGTGRRRVSSGGETRSVVVMSACSPVRSLTDLNVVLSIADDESVSVAALSGLGLDLLDLQHLHDGAVRQLLLRRQRVHATNAACTHARKEGNTMTAIKCSSCQPMTTRAERGEERSQAEAAASAAVGCCIGLTCGELRHGGELLWCVAVW